ncbi:MAG: deoxyhypusine synthase family protein [bacterium]|nr:MAG: deoxyhypusine synthase family protein [bacterium]
MKKPDFLTHPVVAFEPSKHGSVLEAVAAMGTTAFQGKNLSIALDIWIKMIRNDVTIFLGLAGAMVPAGMKGIICYLIQNRFIDCLVSTGANLFHDSHEALGYHHYQGSANVNDVLLKEHSVDRIYDVFASEIEFQQTDKLIGKFASEQFANQNVTTREFLYQWGKYLQSSSKIKNSIVMNAAEHHVPIYCPAVADSSIGIGIAVEKYNNPFEFQFDVIKDVIETAKIVANSSATGVIYLGGGTPKNFIQQTEVVVAIWGEQCEGHKYAIQLTADAPHWGGLSGCTFEEAQSWGKIAKDANMISVATDVTIGLPILAAALHDKTTALNIQPRKQRFDISGVELRFL